MTHDKAAKAAAYQFSKICTEGCCRSAAAQNGFIAGAEWRLEQILSLLKSDEAYESGLQIVPWFERKVKENG